LKNLRNKTPYLKDGAANEIEKYRPLSLMSTF
jgi:hypothetical protein